MFVVTQVCTFEIKCINNILNKTYIYVWNNSVIKCMVF